MNRKPSLRKYDALALLIREHDAIKQLFWDYERLMKRHGDVERKAEVMGQLCMCLSIHAQIEEEIFYPALLALLPKGERAIIDFALRDHQDEKLLIARLDEMEPDDPDYDVMAMDLSINVGPHMYDEEQNLFPKARLAGLDMATVGYQMAQRRRALHADVTRVSARPTAANINAAIGTWPMVCHVESGADVLAQCSWPER